MTPSPVSRKDPVTPSRKNPNPVGIGGTVNTAQHLSKSDTYEIYPVTPCEPRINPVNVVDPVTPSNPVPPKGGDERETGSPKHQATCPSANHSQTSSHAPSAMQSDVSTQTSSVLLWIDWTPVSTANRREHWSAKHRRNVEAGLALRQAQRSASVSLPTLSAAWTTTTSPMPSSPCAMPSQRTSGSMTAIPACVGSMASSRLGAGQGAR